MINKIQDNEYSRAGRRALRNLEDIDDVNVLLLMRGGGYMSVHFVTIPYSLRIDVRHYLVQIRYSLIYKF